MEVFLNEGYVSGARLCWGSMSDPSTTKGKLGGAKGVKSKSGGKQSINILLLTKHLENQLLSVSLQ